MTEFSIDNFVTILRKNIYDNFPYEDEQIKMSKHFNKPLHIRDVAFMDNKVEYIDENKRSFDIGNYYAEKEYPYYHILQDAEVIKKKYRGTAQTKGSQDKIKDRGLRDYNRVTFNGKTFSREYAKNVRGARSKANKILEPKLEYIKGEYRVKRDSMQTYYVNKHYHYIDKILDTVLPWVAQEFGGRMLRKVDIGLEEDYYAQNNSDESEIYMLENMLSSYLD